MINLETDPGQRETAALRRTIQDLAALAALPAIWISSDLPGSLQNLAEVLATAIRARFVFIRVTLAVGETVDVAARNSIRARNGLVDEVRRYLSRHLELEAEEFPSTIPAPDDGADLRVNYSHVAMGGRVRGVVIACSPNESAGRDHDRLLLHTGAAQVAILIQRHEIESKRRAESHKLQTTEAQSEQLMRLLPAGVCVCDATGKVTFFNRRAAELMRGEPGPDETWADFCARYTITADGSAETSRVTAHMLTALHEGRPLRDLELHVVRPDGSEFFATSNIAPLRDSGGQPAGAVNVFYDISERKRSEANAAMLVRLSEKLAGVSDEAQIVELTCRLLGEHLRAARCHIIEYEPNGRRFHVRCGWRRDEALPEFAGAHDVERFVRHDGLQTDFARRAVVPDVVLHPLTAELAANYTSLGIRSLASAPFAREGGRVAAVTVADAKPRVWREDEIALIENVVARVWPMVERARTLAQLRASEERFRMIADNISALAWSAERLGDGTWYNRRWYDYTGTTFDEMATGGWERVHHPDHIARVRETVRAAQESGNVWEDTFPLRGKDGSYRWFLSRAVPIRDAEGRIVRWFGTNTDITELRETQNALQDRSRLLEGINQVGTALLSELDLEKIVQRVTDVGREISGAAFGAFYYKVKNEPGESYALYTLSGAPREAFSKFPLLRNTAFSNPAFQGEGPVRIADVRTDPRLGKIPLDQEMPAGHLPVVSYLAVPVKSRAGEVLGGLFYGHPEANVFTPEAERGLVALASQAAIAIDNANLYRALQEELGRAKQGEEANRRLALIIQSSDDAIIAKDLNGIITSWNPGAARIFGYTAEEVIGKPITILIPPDRQNEEKEILKRIRNGERVDHYETVRWARDGRRVDVSLTVSPVKTATGEILGASKIARDITEKRRIESQQRTLHELADAVNRAVAMPEIYDAALSAIQHCHNGDRASILLYDENGVMRFVAWRGLSDGYRQAVEGHSPWSRNDADPKPVCIENVNTVELASPLRAVIEREGIRALAFIPLVYEKRLLGKFMVYFDTPHAFAPDELRPIETIASQVAFAIEGRKTAAELEALVAERTASLRKVVEQMEEFSYSVSHDLRSPVRAMSGYAEALLDDYGSRLDDQGRELLARIQRNGARMDRLIRDLLTYSRVARREIKMDVVSADRLVREILQHYPEMRPEVATIEIAERLPDVLAHEPSLTQVISNLIGNAVKFVAPGVRPHVHISWERTPKGVRLYFRDNGIGIRPELQRRLFGLFERIHPDQHYEGTGIGLAIVRKAMERMDGATGVISEGISGSRFWIELPVP